MKYLKLFEDSQNEPIEVFYHELKTDEELENFLINHNEEIINQKIVDRINRFVVKNDLDIPDAFITEIRDVFSIQSDYDPDGNIIRKTSNTVIVLEEEEEESENGISANMSYMIGVYSDNWFLVGIIRQDDEHNHSEWNYKCDTIKGLLQLINQWEAFKTDDTHWDDDQIDYYEEEEEAEEEEEEEEDWDEGDYEEEEDEEDGEWVWEDEEDGEWEEDD